MQMTNSLIEMPIKWQLNKKYMRALQWGLYEVIFRFNNE